MSKFSIEIEEISQRVEDIEADNIEEALEIAEEKYSKGEIVLDYQDFKDHEIREYRNQVREEDLVKDNIIPLNYGQAILLEGNKNLALLKQIGKEVEPYIIVTNLQPHRKYGTYFEWDQGERFNSIAEASKKYEDRTNVNKYFNDIIFDKLGEKTLENYNISKFESVDEIFKFLMDDEINKEDLINMLSEGMKKEIVLSYADTVREENGNFYYGQDICFFEDDINDRVKNIDKILNEINIKNIKPYTVIELLEQSDNKQMDKDFSTRVEKLIHESGYEKTAEEFVKYMNEELEKETNEEESEENEILE